MEDSTAPPDKENRPPHQFLTASTTAGQAPKDTGAKSDSNEENSDKLVEDEDNSGKLVEDEGKDDSGTTAPPAEKEQVSAATAPIPAGKRKRHVPPAERQSKKQPRISTAPPAEKEQVSAATAPIPAGKRKRYVPPAERQSKKQPRTRWNQTSAVLPSSYAPPIYGQSVGGRRIPVGKKQQRSPPNIPPPPPPPPPPPQRNDEDEDEEVPLPDNEEEGAPPGDGGDAFSKDASSSQLIMNAGNSVCSLQLTGRVQQSYEQVNDGNSLWNQASPKRNDNDTLQNGSEDEEEVGFADFGGDIDKDALLQDGSEDEEVTPVGGTKTDNNAPGLEQHQRPLQAAGSSTGTSEKNRKKKAKSLRNRLKAQIAAKKKALTRAHDESNGTEIKRLEGELKDSEAELWDTYDKNEKLSMVKQNILAIEKRRKVRTLSTAENEKLQDLEHQASELIKQGFIERSTPMGSEDSLAKHIKIPKIIAKYTLDGNGRMPANMCHRSVYSTFGRRCVDDAVSYAAGQKRILSKKDYTKYWKKYPNFSKTKKEVVTLQVANRILYDHGSPFELKDVFNKPFVYNGQSIQIKEFSQLLRQKQFVWLVGTETTKQYGDVQHCFVLNGGASFIVDGPCKKSWEIEESDYAKTDEEIDEWFHDKGYKQITDVRLLMVSAKAVERGEVPSFVGPLNPHFKKWSHLESLDTTFVEEDDMETAA